MTLVHKGRPLCFYAQGEHPQNLFERWGRTNASVEESKDEEREWVMGAQIM